ncbi:MAG: 3-deoxy-D-manno-octulosonic acid transferase [Deltaproteobacteria bacterium]|nr:3-deoxy-D-manno-octulosonic acid transferase [Deltaproteobacteria bacterium]
MYVLYAVLVHIAFVLVLPLLLLHPKLRSGFRFRLGRMPPGWPGERALRSPRIWLHGASAGDVLALQPIITQLRKELPDCGIVLTVVTRTGFEVARNLPGVDAWGYLPFDLPWTVRRFVRALRPDVLVLEYAEIWPALLRAVKRSGARVVLTNGHFDERALSRYRFFYRLIGNPLVHLDRLCMREPVEARRALAIGAPAERILVTGNTKFDRCRELMDEDGRAVDALRESLGLDPDGLLWVAGSTHRGEEEILLGIFTALRAKHAGLRLLIAPRYPERAGEVQRLAKRVGLAAALRSAGAGDAPVIVLDSIGELASAYRMASVVFVGGSFVRRGGQNILEPAACGRAVLFGPYMHNFADSVRLLLGRGGIQVADGDQLGTTLDELLARPEVLEQLGQTARRAVAAVQGASRADARVIAGLALGARR